MKLKTSFIVPALLIASIFLFNAKEAKSQLVVGLGIEPQLPMGDWADDFAVVGVGGSLTAEYVIDGKIAAGLKLGYTYFILEEDVTEGFDSYNYSMLPIHLRGRYYITGENEDGGLFALAEFGVTRTAISAEASGFEVSESELDPSFDIGIGYEGELGLQASLVYKQVLFGEENVDNPAIIGLRIAYNFVK